MNSRTILGFETSAFVEPLFVSGLFSPRLLVQSFLFTKGVFLLKAQTLNVDLERSNLSPLLRGGGDG